ncbi:MAG: serine hydrolase domain-containing protein [Nitrospirota bacterium]
MAAVINDQLIRTLIADSLAARVFPGGVLLVDVGGRVMFFEAFGRVSELPTAEPMSIATVFDLASLTKPLVTAALTLSFAAERRLSIDDPVGKYLPAWDSGTSARATIRHLLTHTSGLPDWRPFYKEIPRESIATPEGKRRVIDAAEHEPLVSAPGTESRYSDLGFILLGSILERVADRPLDESARERLFAPLGLDSVGFLPVGATEKRAWVSTRSVAATEQCPWRGRVLRGEVHDENAYAMGGVSGHAGLFGDAMAVLRLAREWRDAALGRSPRWPAELAARFLTRHADVGNGSWALGWTVPTPPSTSGRFFSPRSYGHLGFTGTSVWVDPARELTVIVLTNRVHPTRENQGIAAFRPAIHDAIYRGLFEASSAR